MPPNFKQHTFEVLNYLPVFESQYTNSCISKEFVALLIVRIGSLMIMSRTVELYRNSFDRTVEIEDVWSGAVLPAELTIFELAMLQVFPQQRFSRREI